MSPYGGGDRIQYNNIYNNGNNIFNAGSYNASAEYNWWGTFDEGMIKQKLYPLSKINYTPYLLSPFEGKEFLVRSINLTKGWNLISLPLLLKSPALPDSLKTISFSHVFMHSNNSWKGYRYGFQNKSNLLNLNESMGIWIKSGKNQTLLVEGLPFENISAPLKKGWSLARSPVLNSTPINETFNLSQVSIVLMYDNSRWYGFNVRKPDSLNSLKFIVPGYGYWVRVD